MDLASLCRIYRERARPPGNGFCSLSLSLHVQRGVLCCCCVFIGIESKRGPRKTWLGRGTCRQKWPSGWPRSVRACRGNPRLARDTHTHMSFRTCVCGGDPAFYNCDSDGGGALLPPHTQSFFQPIYFSPKLYIYSSSSCCSARGERDAGCCHLRPPKNIRVYQLYGAASGLGRLSPPVVCSRATRAIEIVASIQMRPSNRYYR